MIKLYVDGRQADIDQRAKITLSLSEESTASLSSARKQTPLVVAIPMTAANKQLMGNCEQVNAAKRFNDEKHTARLEVDGCTIAEGVVQLVGCDCDSGGGEYTVRIGGEKDWSRHMSVNGLSSMFPEWSTTINGPNISSSWTWSAPVRFLPVQRSEYKLTNSSVSIMPPDRILTTSDYHPFINLREAISRMFKDAGYSVSSEFMDSDMFRSLYMSGNYPQRDAELLKKKMDFVAGRFKQSAAVANASGRVYADPIARYNTIGNIVDTADPNETSSGVKLNGVFTNNGCFGKSGERVVFTPPHEVSVGFEYKLRYVTDYTFKSASELNGFNQIYLGTNDLRTLKISNRFEDQRTDFVYGRSYRFVIPNHIEGDKYQVNVWKVTNPNADLENLKPSDYYAVAVKAFSAKSILLSPNATGWYTNIYVMRAKAGSNTYTAYNGEWMVYDGYVDEAGKTEVELTITSKAEIVTPSKPKYFDNIYFGGAWQNANLTLLSAEVRPIFLPHPTEGSKVSFAEVAAHGVSRLDVLKAVDSMFDLRFHTDELDKKVYIEPRKELYDGSVDWSEKVVAPRKYAIEEIGVDIPEKITFRYSSGDHMVSRWNALNGGRLGEWTIETGTQNASIADKVYENKLFRPSVNTNRCLPSSLSASWLQVGNRDSEGNTLGDGLNFPPKVVSYRGLKGLPQGESWGWPAVMSGTQKYPLLAFHYPGSGKDGFSLCFEDRDGIEGLNSYWEDEVALGAAGRRLTIDMKLAPSDIEPFVVPNRLKRDFRSKFRLKVDGELSDWRLEKIENYSPSTGIAKCVFVKE